jgi:prevent-host-death family protein
MTATATATVRVAELKSKLSEHLRAVREGHEFLIQDRDKPVARLVPVESAKKKVPVRPGRRTVPNLNDLPRLSLPGVEPADFEEALEESRKDRIDL